MASLRRNKNFCPDPQAKFLYAIIKQLDLRAVDWQEIADQININNGHAARMRFSRLKSQFESHAPQQRAPRSSKDEKKKNKSKGMKPGFELNMREISDDEDEDIKPNKKEMMGFSSSNIKIEPQSVVKMEEETAAMPFIKPDPMPESPLFLGSNEPYLNPPMPNPTFQNFTGTLCPTDLHQMTPRSMYSHSPGVGYNNHMSMAGRSTCPLPQIKHEPSAFDLMEISKH